MNNKKSAVKEYEPIIRRKSTFPKGSKEIIHDIFQRIRDGEIDLVEKLILNDISATTNTAISKCRWSGWTLLHRAAECGHTDICYILLENGAKINQKTIWGWHTPLHVAMGNGWIDTAVFLLDNGALPHLKNKVGLDVFEYARKRNYKDAAMELDAYIMKAKNASSLNTKMLFLGGGTTSNKSSKDRSSSSSDINLDKNGDGVDDGIDDDDEEHV